MRPLEGTVMVERERREEDTMVEPVVPSVAPEPAPPADAGPSELAPGLSALYAVARAEAVRMRHTTLTADHYLYAAILLRNNSIYDLLEHHGLVEEARTFAERILARYPVHKPHVQLETQ
jgi:hypothetical protein